MKLNDHFRAFIGEISLNPTRIDRIERAYETWKSKFKEDEEIKKIFLDFFLQGSYATDTAIRPQNNNEFDVDAVLLLDLEDNLAPKEALNWLAERMKSDETYKDKIIVKDRCVRIDYAGDFHMDIVLAKPTDEDYVLIPSKKEGEWVETNPAGYVEWCKEVQSNNLYKFTNVTKMVKFWRDQKVGKETAPKSILLTTLLGRYMVGKNSDAESLVETLDNLLQNIDSIVQDDGTTYVENPSLEDENLARDWDADKLIIFKKKLIGFHDAAKDALDEPNKEKSIEKWQNIFGSKFPSELSEGYAMASAIRQGSILVSSSGLLNKKEGISIPQHRFYGG